MSTAKLPTGSKPDSGRFQGGGLRLVDDYLARTLGDSTPPPTPPHPAQTRSESGIA